MGVGRCNADPLAGPVLRQDSYLNKQGLRVGVDLRKMMNNEQKRAFLFPFSVVGTFSLCLCAV